MNKINVQKIKEKIQLSPLNSTISHLDDEVRQNKIPTFAVNTARKFHVEKCTNDSTRALHEQSTTRAPKLVSPTIRPCPPETKETFNE